MKKLMLDVDALTVETFAVGESLVRPRGTVEGAVASVFFSGCLSCRPSGIQHCFNTQTCC
jgi:hypothetical protein